MRAGLWSRKAVINESIECGSVLPQLRECQKRGWACLVMNPNKSNDDEGNKINFCGNMAIHASYVWNQYVLTSGIPKIYLIAHSAGGWCTTSIMKAFGK